MPRMNRAAAPFGQLVTNSNSQAKLLSAERTFVTRLRFVGGSPVEPRSIAPLLSLAPRASCAEVGLVRSRSHT